MERKAASTLLILMVPGCLGYPATLNVNPREKKSPAAVESAPPTTVVSPRPRWLVIQAPIDQSPTSGGCPPYKGITAPVAAGWLL